MKTPRISAILPLILALACCASGDETTALSLGIHNVGAMYVPDMGLVMKYGLCSGFPDDAFVTSVRYYVSLVDSEWYVGREGWKSEINFWCSDYEIYIGNDTHGVYYQCVWDHKGGRTDEGWDDDADDDYDIWLNDRTLAKAFDGDPVNQRWYVCVKDTASHGLPGFGGLGKLLRIELTITYRVPAKPDLCDGGEAYRSFSPRTVVAGQPGQSLEVRFLMENRGDGPTGGFEIAAYASVDAAIRNSDYLLFWEGHLGMQPSSDRSAVLRGTFPTNIPAGTYYVGWIIDANGRVAESDETNNTAYKEGYQLTVLGDEPEPDVQVPDVVGMARADAESTLTSTGLAVGAISEAHSDTVPKGHVISQDPAAGTWVSGGSAVDLVISAGPPVPGLVAHWKLDEDRGTVAHDSAADNDGILYGGPVWQPAGGVIDGALEFDGMDDYVDCGNDASLNITDQMTIAAWIATQDSGNSEFNPYVTKGDHSYALKHNMWNNLAFTIYDVDWHTAWFPVGSSYNGDWHHVAGTYDGRVVKLYVDGILEGTTTHTGSIAGTTDNVNMARNSEITDRSYDGMLDDVRIYSYALSPAEIGQLVWPDPQVVPGKALYVLTRSGIVHVSLTGAQQMLLDAHQTSRDLEIRDNTLYVTDKTRGGDIVVYDLQGNYRQRIAVRLQAGEYTRFVVLPDERFALLDNTNDRVFFIDNQGNLLGTTPIQDPRGSSQHLDGLVVGNRLIVSQDGQQRVLQVDLTSYEASLFKDLGSLSDRLGPITYADGAYYICGTRTVYAFTASGSAAPVAELPEGNITGIAVVDGTAYVSVNFTGEIYAVDLHSGAAGVLASGLDYPVDLECGTALESAAETEHFELRMQAGALGVPDADSACWVFTEPYLTSLPPIPTWAPEGAVVARIEYKLAVRGPDLRCRDYEIHLDNDPYDSDPGVRLYDNQGGLTDEGYDDDVENDRDLELGWTATHVFDGQSVHQDWTVCVSDTVSGHSGYLAELCLHIFYEVDSD